MVRWINTPGPRIAATLALIAGFVAAAGISTTLPDQEIQAGQVRVNGQFGATPVVEFMTPFPLQPAQAEVLDRGDGRRIRGGDAVVLIMNAFEGADGRPVEGTGEPQVLFATSEDVGNTLQSALVGATEGSRLLVREPTSAGSASEMMLIVVDVLHTEAAGEEISTGNDRVSVEINNDGPQLTVAQGAEPQTSLQIVQLIRGTGTQVMPGQTVIVQYVSRTWDDSAPLETTWDDRVPAVLELDTAFPGVREGLLDQPIGSRVLLEIPAAEGLGTQNLLMVIDILAAS